MSQETFLKGPKLRLTSRKRDHTRTHTQVSADECAELDEAAERDTGSGDGVAAATEASSPEEVRRFQRILSETAHSGLYVCLSVRCFLSCCGFGYKAVSSV